MVFLDKLGHDAVHLSEQRLHRLPDPQIIEKARNESRIILTHDLDFGTLMAASSAHLPSIVIFRLSDMKPETVNTFLQQILLHYSEPLMQGAILSVNERQIRVRYLPIKD